MGRKRVFVGGIPDGTRESDLERFFEGFGRLEEVILKDAFAFVEFQSSRDAEDAVYDMNGKNLLGKRVSVEMSRDRYDARSNKANRHFREGQRRVAIRTKHRVKVENVSSRVTWQVLKDYMRQAGDVTYAQILHRNVGEVDFASRSDLKAAFNLLDGTELIGRRIRLVEDDRTKTKRSSSSSRHRTSRNSSSLSSDLRRCSRSPSRTASPKCTRSPGRVMSHCCSKSRSPASPHRRSRSCSSARSHNRTESNTRSRSRSLNKSCSYLAKGYRSHGDSTTGSSRSRPRLGSETEDCGFKRCFQDRSRSRSGSSKSIEDFRAHSKKLSRSWNHSDSPNKRLKLSEVSQGRDHYESHPSEAENVSSSTIEPAHIQEY